LPPDTAWVRILEAVSENEALPLVEPHLDTILERLDEIEPFMPFVLHNLIALAPYTGAILDHFDSLVLYGDEGGKYLEVLLPFLPTFAPLFDPLGPHLALLRPHLPQVLPHLAVIAPHAGRFAPHVAVSANADVLIWYFGWVLRIKYLNHFVMGLPFLPRLANFLLRYLPRRPVRGRTWDLVCDYDECDLTQYETTFTACRSYTLIEADKSALRSLFECIDLDGNGYVSSKEWGQAVRSNWNEMSYAFSGMTKSEVGRMFKKLDADGSGDLTWSELEALLPSNGKWRRLRCFGDALRQRWDALRAWAGGTASSCHGTACRVA